MKLRKFLPICVFLFLLTGCGTATTIDSSTSVHPDVLHVLRPATLNNVPRFERTVRDSVTIQRLFKTAYALPAASKGIMSCPIDLDIVYHLSFLHGTTLIQEMTLYPTGCSALQIGQDTSNLRFVPYDFEQLTAKTIGLASLVPKIG